jgi:hypothetical protein
VRRALLGFALAAGLVAGCGGSDKPSDKDQITKVLTTYYTAFGSGDTAGACDELAADTKDALEKAAGGKDCAKVLDAALKRPDYARIASKLGNAKVTLVNFAADKATARIVLPDVPGAGGLGAKTVVPLKKEHGAWKIASAIGEG